VRNMRDSWIANAGSWIIVVLCAMIGLSIVSVNEVLKSGIKRPGLFIAQMSAALVGAMLIVARDERRPAEGEKDIRKKRARLGDRCWNAFSSGVAARYGVDVLGTLLNIGR